MRLHNISFVSGWNSGIPGTCTHVMSNCLRCCCLEMAAQYTETACLRTGAYLPPLTGKARFINCLKEGASETPAGPNMDACTIARAPGLAEGRRYVRPLSAPHSFGCGSSSVPLWRGTPITSCLPATHSSSKAWLSAHTARCPSQWISTTTSSSALPRRGPLSAVRDCQLEMLGMNRSV